MKQVGASPNNPLKTVFQDFVNPGECCMYWACYGRSFLFSLQGTVDLEEAQRPRGRWLRVQSEVGALHGALVQSSMLEFTIF